MFKSFEAQQATHLFGLAFADLLAAKTGDRSVLPRAIARFRSVSEWISPDSWPQLAFECSYGRDEALCLLYQVQQQPTPVKSAKKRQR